MRNEDHPGFGVAARPFNFTVLATSYRTTKSFFGFLLRLLLIRSLSRGLTTFLDRLHSVSTIAWSIPEFVAACFTISAERKFRLSGT